MPPRVPNGSPRPSQPDCASGARKLSVTGDGSLTPTAFSVTRRATLRYRSRSNGDIESASPMLSNPPAIPSGGSSSAIGNSIESRSRIALAYSSRFKRRITGRPAYGLERTAASRSVTTPAENSLTVAALGRGAPGGGISPAFSFRTNRSQTSGRAAGFDVSIFWSTRRRPSNCHYGIPRSIDRESHAVRLTNLPQPATCQLRRMRTRRERERPETVGGDRLRTQGHLHSECSAYLKIAASARVGGFVACSISR